MAHVIEVKGKAVVVFGLKDLMELIDQHMGMEFRTTLEETLTETYASEYEWAEILREHHSELDEIREHYHNVIRDIRDQSEELVGLIREKRLNRNAISKCAGKIGTLTWREL